MNLKPICLLLVTAILLAACGTAEPPLLEPSMGQEFTLAPGQSAWVADAGLTITFHSILSDERCPSEVECVVSGPVTVSLSIQEETDDPTDVTLQTFTDTSGRSPEGQFEGIMSQVEVGEYQVEILGVTPYPQVPEPKIEPSEYRVTLSVSNE